MKEVWRGGAIRVYEVRDIHVSRNILVTKKQRSGDKRGWCDAALRPGLMSMPGGEERGLIRRGF